MHSETSGHSHTVEIERKYDVGVGVTLPDLLGLPGVVSVDPVDARQLDAVYFDSPSLVLARRSVALRRRRGGPDEGWHVKTTEEDGRHEYGWPLDDGGDDPSDLVIPEIVVEAVRAWIGDEPLHPIARVRNDRDAYLLRDADGQVIAEFTDDSVSADDLARGESTHWREWEFELGPAAPVGEEGRSALFAEVDAAVAAVGGAPAASGSKLQRALGR